MHCNTVLLLVLLANAASSHANLLSRGSEHVARAAHRARHSVVKRSSGLAKDLKLAYAGIFLQQQPGESTQYCVNTNTNGSSLTGGNGQSGTSSASPPAATGGTAASSPWKTAQTYEGSTFFDGWTFFTAGDPTGGVVDYVDQGTAQSGNLTEINSAGNVVMRVDTTATITGNRKSVRITTDYTYNVGTLLVLDVVHIPTGCGTWPAFWSNGPNWPAGGEIDIVEGVNTYTNNQATLHTNTGCSLPSSNPSVLAMNGALTAGTDCSVGGTGDTGCGIRSTSANSFGPTFNNIGGGVYAMSWTTSGIQVYFFPRSSIPADINAGTPQPSGWGTPMANFPSSSCNPSTFFYDHSAIFDTTLCGAWAGDAWDQAGMPGQTTSCAQSTGTSACAAYVQNNGGAFSEAYWEVKSVKIYQGS